MVWDMVPVVAVCPGSIPVPIHGLGVKAANNTKVLTDTIHDVPKQKKLLDAALTKLTQ